ncbi:lipoate--protein ligase [bacterium]|nr:lipoate--protein ligase [bacterium]MCP5462069.1 lipoate--protein ligase [bacterium]
MSLNTEIIYSQNTDPWYNLALEEYLLNTLPQSAVRLYLYVNDASVVIGKNQNPWNECAVKLLFVENVRLARRITGGGAVYHDCGNLNYSFIAGRRFFDSGKQLDLILSAVRQCGIDAKKNERHDLVVGNRKFSGNAFCYRKDTAIHHGTVLISADEKKLKRYLTPDIDSMETRAVKSVRSEIVNLRAVQPELTIESIVDAIVNEFKKIYGTTANLQEDIPFPEEEQMYKRYSSWEWLYGRTPDFKVAVGENGNTVMLVVANGKVQQAVVCCSNSVRRKNNISSRLEGMEFDEYKIKAVIEKTAHKRKLIP